MSPNDGTPDEPFGKLIQQCQEAIENQDFDIAELTIHELSALAEKWCEENPSPVNDLTTVALECEERGDWHAAESAFSQMLSLSSCDSVAEYAAHSKLASLFRLLDRDSGALEHSRCATAAARRADLSILLVMSLKEQARCLIHCGEIVEAVNVIAEAISEIDDRSMYNQMRASLFTLRAECSICGGAFCEAEHDLDQAIRLLEPMAALECAAGVYCDLSDWWGVTAQLRAKRDDHNDSVNAWRKAVATAKHVASLPHADNVYTRARVANLLKCLADELTLSGRPVDAANAMDERNSILSQIKLQRTEAK